MIKTRFDNSEVWETKDKEYEISKMETAHIINLLRMFKTKPMVVMRILLDSVEESCFSFSRNKKKEALYEITSMSEEELIDVAMNSVLVAALYDQLEERGVNIVNIENMLNGLAIEREDK